MGEHPQGQWFRGHQVRQCGFFVHRYRKEACKYHLLYLLGLDEHRLQGVLTEEFYGQSGHLSGVKGLKTFRYSLLLDKN
jgi:hypothetical protein